MNQDHVGGLEVLTPDGKWIEGVPIPNSFIVNIGDMLYVTIGDRVYPLPEFGKL